MNEKLIPADANIADFINANEFRSGPVKTAQNGKSYVEQDAGRAKEGMVAVRFIKRREGGKSSGALLGYEKQVVGKVASLGQAFRYAGSQVDSQRAYLEG